jgi:tetratricopeptide (TPR) repeat protein
MASRRSMSKKSKFKNPRLEIPVIDKNPSPSKPSPGRARLWIFRLAALVLMPLVFFSLLEIGLQLRGYGYPVDFYISPDHSGSFITNEKFGWRFLTEDLSRSPAPEIIAEKSDGTIRIYILGESAAQGVPEPNFSFGSILEALLRNRYPGVRFEVVNAAVTAINSYAVLEITKNCADYQPDLFVVYMGNNEVVGPYGPGTVFEKWTPSLRLIRANLWVKSMRTGQLLEDMVHSFYSSEESIDKFRGMEMFLDKPIAADDPRMETVYDNFRRNLMDICEVGRQAGTPVILSTVAVNLKDCPPFASVHRNDISEADLKRWESAYQTGIKMESNNQWQEALEQYESAARLDGHFAELHYRMGRCLAAEDRIEDARERFSLARNLDVLRFRADSNINRIIREVAEAKKAGGVYGVDAEKILASGDSPAGAIPGEELFFEHVHFKFYGNYLLARAVLGRVETALPRLAASRKQILDLTVEECEKALALTPRDEYKLLVQMQSMMSRPPFTYQLDHEKRIADLKERTARFEELSSQPEVFLDARKDYEAVLKNTPDDWTLQQRFGNLLYDGGEYELAADQLEIARKQYPWLSSLYVELGDAEQKSGREIEAIACYQRALEINPDLVDAHNNLGAAMGRQGRIGEAVAHYRRALEIDPDHEIVRVNLGSRLIELGQIEEAVTHFRKVLETYPENFLSYYGLGYAMYSMGRIEEAVTYYRKALEIEPHCEPARINLGSTLMDQGKIDEAVTHFRYAADDNPGNVEACLSLARGLTYQGNNGEAMVYYRKTLELEPGNGMAHFYLGVALTQQGYPHEAAAHFKQAIEIDPRFSKELQSFLDEKNFDLN